jgi:ATPase subunit of ABC transporter with duplicated ATPase domains
VQSLSLDNVAKYLGTTLVLDGVSLLVGPRSRIGVVGPNGVGKTTLLRLLAGIERPDDGRVLRAPDSLRIGYLPQEAHARGAETVLEYLGRRTGTAEAGADLEALASGLERDPGLAERYSDALDRFLVLGGHDLAARAGAACLEVGLEAAVLKRPLRELSGGQASAQRSPRFSSRGSTSFSSTSPRTTSTSVGSRPSSASWPRRRPQSSSSPTTGPSSTAR